jgi:hypothetical protein
MRTEWLSLDARVAAADPARSLMIDERARELLRARIGAEPQHRRAPWDNRLRARLRRLMILLPSLAVLGGVGLGAESAWCAPCRHHVPAPAARNTSTAAPDLRISRRAQPQHALPRRASTSGG